MLKVKGVVSISMNACWGSGQGGGIGDKTGWWSRRGHSTCNTRVKTMEKGGATK